MPLRPPAIVLLSGGLDSATALAIARADGFNCLALSFRYGQRHEIEIEAARAVAKALGAGEHRVAEIDLRAFGGSALTDDIPVPAGRRVELETGASETGAGAVSGARSGADSGAAEIPVTYVPARNTIFLSYALALAEVRRADDIFIGVNAVDYSGYPDCRPEYIAAFERLAALATKAGVQGRPVRIRAPLIDLPKEEIIRRGLSLGVDYGLTRSCYDPDAAGRACGRCDSCRLRLAAFARLGVADPAPYR